MAQKSVRGTETEKNLAISYLSESYYPIYDFFGEQADKELYFPIGAFFKETAISEKCHAHIFQNFLQTLSVVPPAADAFGVSTTLDNLKFAVGAEKAGAQDYLRYADTAEKEGFPEIASRYRAIAKMEKHHFELITKFIEQIEKGTVWKRETPVTWKCLVCNYEGQGLEPPEVCPVCGQTHHHFTASDILI